MKTVRWYSPEGDADQGGTSDNDSESVLLQEGAHQHGDTSLDDQEELPGGYIHGHVDQDKDDE